MPILVPLACRCAQFIGEIGGISAKAGNLLQ